MQQWTPSQSLLQSENLQTICSVYVPDSLVLLVDFGLHNAGWSLARSIEPLELHEVIGDRAKFCWINDTDTVEVVTPAVFPSANQLAARIYADGPERASSDGLVRILDDIFSLLGSEVFLAIDTLMQSLDLSRSAPEYLVGILRATSNDTQHLAHWGEFLARVKSELARRKMNPATILIGLL